jgi:hypothetical protein
VPFLFSASVEIQERKEDDKGCHLNAEHCTELLWFIFYTPNNTQRLAVEELEDHYSEHKHGEGGISLCEKACGLIVVYQHGNLNRVRDGPDSSLA